MSKQYLSLFAGIGGSAFGAKAAGYQLIGAVEMDARIGDLYYQNHQSLVIYSDVKNVNPNVFPTRTKDDILCVQLSPPCQPYSAANAFPDLTSDRALALDNCYRILSHLQPEQIVIENVRAYQQSPPMDRFREWLTSNDYRYIEQIVNCADIGLPQARIRYFLMAVKGDRKLNYLPLTHSKTDYLQLEQQDSPIIAVPSLMAGGMRVSDRLHPLTRCKGIASRR